VTGCNYSVSFNTYFDSSYDHNQSDLIKTSEEFIKRIPKSFDGYHIAIHHMPNSNFAEFDVIVAVYDPYKKRNIYQYQLKEAENNPAYHDNHINVWLKGHPSDPRNHLGWIFPESKEIDEFFGESGKHWTPKCWDILNTKPEEKIKFKKQKCSALIGEIHIT